MAISGAPPLSEPQVKLVRSAYRLMAERGVQRVSLEDIADDAGVSKGLVLYYFKTRENLVLATMEWVLGQVADRIRAAVDRAESPRDKVAAMVRVIFESPEANRRFYLTYLELVEHAARLESFGRLSATFREMENGLYAEVVRAGVKARAFHAKDVDQTAAVLRAIVEGLSLQWLQDPDTSPKSHTRYRKLCEKALLTQLRA